MVLTMSMAVVLGMAIPWDKIPWDKIFAWAEKMFAQCAAEPTPPTPEEQIEMLRNPSGRFRNKLERVTERGCKRNGMSGQEWRQNRKDIMKAVYEDARNATDEEALQFIQRAALRLDEDESDDDEEGSDE